MGHINATLRAGIPLALLLAGAPGCSQERAAPPPHPLAELTGARTRVVWCRQVVGPNNDPFADGEHFILMGLDTHDGRGERTLLGEVSCYGKPLLSPDGETVVYTHHPTHRIFAADWEGGAPRFLAGGLALDLWRDPADGVTWLIYAERRKEHEYKNGGPVYRCRLDRPETRELLWDRTEVTADNFQLSRDGRCAGGLFPWNHAGLADLTRGAWDRIGKGCWTSTAPDNSYMMWIFDGAHKNIQLYPFGGGVSRRIKLNSAPGTEGFEIYHPRWSNHVRFLAISGPYRIRGTHNAIAGGGEGINLYVGRFDEAYTRIEAWVQVTDAPQGDFFPDVWIEGGELHDAGAARTEAGAVQLAPRVGRWPATETGLIYVWDHAAAPNEIPAAHGERREVKTQRRGRALLGRHFEADVTGGWLEAPEAGSIAPATLQRTGAFTLELVLQPSGAERPTVGVVAGFATNLEDGNLLLLERNREVYLRLRTDESPFTEDREVHLFRLHPTQALHVAMTYGGGELTWYVNGVAVSSFHDLRGGLSSWSEHPLSFGALPGGEANWPGRLEGLALFERVLSPAEVGAHAREREARLAARSPPAVRLVEARLIEPTPVPTPESIAPYRAGLVESLYEVTRVLEGTLDEPRIIVQQWGILDGAVVPLDHRVGESYTLRLEPASEHPELEGERVSSQLSDPTLPVYLEVR